MRAEIRELIQNSANDLTISTKQAVAQLLSQFEHQELFESISDYMDNPSLGRREWIICIKTLCQIDRVQANKRFIEALEVDDADKRFRIVKLLGSECGTEHIVPKLIEMLKDDTHPGIRFIVATTLGNIGDLRALPALEWSATNDNDLNHEDQSVASEAKRSIEKLKVH